MTNYFTNVTSNVCLALVYAILLQGMPAQAETTFVQVQVTVVAPPPCVINGGQTLEVDFGNEIFTTRVDGNNYRQPIPYTVECSDYSTNAMTLEVQGVEAGFGANVLHTNKPDLGIALFSGNANEPLKLGTPIQFTYPAIPVLSAVPIKRPGSKLTAGDFLTAATIKVDYQ